MYPIYLIDLVIGILLMLMYLLLIDLSIDRDTIIIFIIIILTLPITLLSTITQLDSYESVAYLQLDSTETKCIQSER